MSMDITLERFVPRGFSFSLTSTYLTLPQVLCLPNTVLYLANTVLLDLMQCPPEGAQRSVLLAIIPDL